MCFVVVYVFSLGRVLLYTVFMAFPSPKTLAKYLVKNLVKNRGGGWVAFINRRWSIHPCLSLRSNAKSLSEFSSRGEVGDISNSVFSILRVQNPVLQASEVCRKVEEVGTEIFHLCSSKSDFMEPNDGQKAL